MKDPNRIATRQKLWSLAILVLQNSSLVLMLRFSRTSSTEKYLNSTAVFFGEIAKVLMCLFLLLWEAARDQPGATKGEIVTSWLSSLKKTIFCWDLAWMLVPSGLYAAQNNLLFLAVSNLDAATYQVTYQMKILTTALFSFLLLNKRLSKPKVFALFLLMAGIVLVQWPSGGAQRTLSQDSNPIVGLIAVFTASITSGFAGVYFEKVLKNANSNIWARNVQLGICSFGFCAAAIVMNDWAAVREHGLLHGYNWLTWFVVLNQGFGGLLVAFVIRYADNIAKCFASSIAIVLSGIVSTYLGDFHPTFRFIIGAIIVICSVFIYSDVRKAPGIRTGFQSQKLV